MVIVLEKGGGLVEAMGTRLSYVCTCVSGK